MMYNDDGMYYLTMCVSVLLVRRQKKAAKTLNGYNIIQECEIAVLHDACEKAVK